MRTDTRDTTVAPGVIPPTFTEVVGDPPPAPPPNTDRAREAAAAASGVETPAQYSSRKALRGRLNGYAVAAVALVVVLIALAASNTAHVKVNWILGSSHVSVVWLVLVAAIVGGLLGLLASARIRWLTRALQHHNEAPS